jgi:hypothetical protein
MHPGRDEGRLFPMKGGQRRTSRFGGEHSRDCEVVLYGIFGRVMARPEIDQGQTSRMEPGLV